MPTSRTEKYREYRASIANATDKIPVLKSANNDYACESGLYKKIVLKRRIINSSVVVLIIAIITFLVIFGIKLF